MSEATESVIDAKETVRQFIENVWNGANWDALPDYWTPDCINHLLPPGQDTGAEALRAAHTPFFTGFSRIHVEIHDQIGEASRVATYFTFSGIHTGDYRGIAATGKTVAIQGVRIDRIENGKIAEHWGVFDLSSLHEQIAFGH